MATMSPADERHGILVVGGGLVGSTLAALLAQQGRDVTLVERDRDVATELAAQLGDVRVLEGNGTTGVALRKAGIERAELVIAVTQYDEANLVAGLLAASFDVPRLIVRVRDPDHSRSLERLRSDAHRGDILAVNPTLAAAEKIASLLAIPGARDVSSFLAGELIIAGFPIHAHSDFVDLGIRNVDLMFAGTPTLVAAIRRGPDWVIPRGDDELREGDVAYFAVGRDHLDSILELMGAERHERPHIMIAGATEVGLALARHLESDEESSAEGVFFDEQQRLRKHARVTLIEEDTERATAASGALKEALVVHGLATDQALLEEEEIEQVSTFVAATDDHETNLVAALLAKRLGGQRAFALVDNPAIASLVSDIGIDAPIVPRQLTIDLALSYIRGDRVVSVATLLQEGMEVFEGEVDEKSPLCEGPIHQVASRLPGAIVVAVHHDAQVFIPRGDFRIAPGDHVVVLAAKAQAERIGKFLSATD